MNEYFLFVCASSFKCISKSFSCEVKIEPRRTKKSTRLAIAVGVFQLLVAPAGYFYRSAKNKWKSKLKMLMN